MFSLMCTRINGWVNNGEAGDLRRHRAHYDVIVMKCMGAYSTLFLYCCVGAKTPPMDTLVLNILKPRQDGRYFPDDIFKCIFLNEKVLILIKISLKFVPKCSINNIPALVQIMAWRRPGDKPLSEPMMASFPTHRCITRPQWVKHQAISNHSVDKIFIVLDKFNSKTLHF